jgi:glucose-1-phosphate thymidylyltransferase
MERKGIILAGGAGTPLDPFTLVKGRQLLPVCEPMVHNPLSVLRLAGIRDILIISTGQDLPRFWQVLGDGHQWGLRFAYAEQARPAGIAEAIIIGGEHYGPGPSALVLGDNFFAGPGLVDLLSSADRRRQGATVFAYRVPDPQRYEVVEFDGSGKALDIQEKPGAPRSHYAVTGLYFYDEMALELARGLKPSDRGELEITDLNREYLHRQALHVEVMDRGHAWLDTRTIESLIEEVATLRPVRLRSRRRRRVRSGPSVQTRQ